MEFNQIYQLLESHGTIPSKRIAASDLWATLTEQQQAFVCSTIEKKISDGKFVHFDPVKAIRENLPKVKLNAPHNYRGEIIPSGLQVFSAAYNGVFGMYTQADIKTYGLTLPAIL